MHKSPRGFTLTEVLVAISVLSLIVLATASALRTFADTQLRIERTTARLDEMRMAGGFLRNSLRQAVAMSTSMEFSQYFIGRSAEVSWLGPMLAAGDVSGLHYIRIFLEDTELRIQLIPYRRAIGRPEWDGVISYRLLGEVDQALFEYRPALGEDWTSEWSMDEMGIPQAVRLRLSVTGRFWPDMLVAIDQHGRRL